MYGSIAGGTLFHQLFQQGSYSEDQACSIIQQLLHGLEYLHANGVVHRDLKPENLLFDTDSKRLVITDFGLANVINAKESDSDALLHTQCGTIGYAGMSV
jgi:calcium/calmodulin-dependent protein kinase I